jgi:hypothetical protein
MGHNFLASPLHALSCPVFINADEAVQVVGHEGHFVEMQKFVGAGFRRLNYAQHVGIG